MTNEVNKMSGSEHGRTAVRRVRAGADVRAKYFRHRFGARFRALALTIAVSLVWLDVAWALDPRQKLLDDAEFFLQMQSEGARTGAPETPSDNFSLQNDALIGAQSALQELESANFDASATPSAAAEPALTLKTSAGDLLHMTGGEIERITRADGTVLAGLEFDADGRITDADLRLADGTVQVIQGGAVTASRLPDGTDVLYNAQGRIEKAVTPDGREILYAYVLEADGAVRSVTVTSPEAVSEYDAQGRVLRSIFADGKKVFYDQGVLERVEESGRVYEYARSGSGDEVRAVLRAVTDAAEDRYELDDTGVVRSAARADGTRIDVTRWENGAPADARVTTAAGETFEYTAGRLTRSIDASGQESIITAGPDGTTVVTPALGRTVLYDTAGNALRASFADGSVTEYHAAGAYQGYVSRQVSSSGVVTLYDYTAVGTGPVTAARKEPVTSLTQSTKYASSTAISYRNNPWLSTTFSFGTASADAVIRMNAANTAAANIAVTLVPGAGSTYRFGTGPVMSLGVNLSPSKNYTAEMRWEAAGIGLYVYEQGSARPAASQARIASKAWNPKFNLESVNTVRASYTPSSGAFTKNFSAVEKTGAVLVGNPSHRTYFKFDSSSTANKVTITAAMPAVGAVRETFTFTWASGRWTLTKSSYNSTTKRTVTAASAFAQTLVPGREYFAEVRVENGKIGLYVNDAALARPAVPMLSSAALATAATVTAAAVNAAARAEAFRNNAAVNVSTLRAPSVPGDVRGREELARIASDAAALVRPEVVKAEYRAGKLTSALQKDGTAVEFENGLLRRAGGADFLFEESAYGNLASMTVETSGLKTSYDAKGRLRSVATTDAQGVEQTVWYEDGRVTRIEKADGTVISDIVFEDAAGATGTIRDAVVRTADGAVRRYAGGRILEERKADGTMTVFADGRPAESRMADGRVYVYRTDGGVTQMTLREYRDAAGDLVELDEASGVPVRITRTNGDVLTGLEFDAAGELTAAAVRTRAASGKNWTLQYVGRELIEAVSEPEPGSGSAFGQKVRYEGGRIAKIETAGEADRVFTHAVSVSGALVSTSVRYEDETRTFDAMGRLVAYESPAFRAEYESDGGLRALWSDHVLYERPVFDAADKLVSARILTQDGTVYTVTEGRLVRTVRPDGVETAFDADGLVTRIVERAGETAFEYVRGASGRIEDIRVLLPNAAVPSTLPDLLKSGPNPGYWPVQGSGGWHRLTRYSLFGSVVTEDGMVHASYESRPASDPAANVFISSSTASGTSDRTGVRFYFDNVRPIEVRQNGYLFVKLRIDNAPGITAVHVKPFGAGQTAGLLAPIGRTYAVADGTVHAFLPVGTGVEANIWEMAVDFVPPQAAGASWTVAVEQAGYFELNTELSKAHQPFMDLTEARQRARDEAIAARASMVPGWPSSIPAFDRFASAGDRAVRMTLDADGTAAASSLADGSAFVYASGRANAVTAPDGTVTEYFYDADGSVERTKVTAAAGASGPGAAVVTRYAYGRIREVTDAAGAVLYRYAYEFEGDSEIVVITDARSGEVKRYSGTRLLSSLDAQGLLTTYSYLTPSGAADIGTGGQTGGTERITSSVVTWKGRELHRFTYTYADGETRVTGADGITKIYDAAGVLTHVETADGVRYRRSELTDGAGARFEEHALHSVRTDDGVTLFYKEDTVERIVLKDGTTLEVGVEDGRFRNVLLKEGLVDEVIHEDGSTARYLRDEIGRLAAVDVTRAGRVHRYNPAGELVRVTDPASGEVSEYGFRKDAEGRVTHTRVIRRVFSGVAGLELSVPLRAASYGMMDGWNSSITVDGTDYSDFNFDLWTSDKKYYGRGWSVVHVDEQGRVLKKGYFDPYLSGAGEADRMAVFLESIPQGDLAVIAVADEGSKNLTPRAIEAVEAFGSLLVKGLGYRDSFALIGRKGAPAGSAIEDLKRLGEGPVIISNADTQIFYYDAEGRPVSYEDFANGPRMTWSAEHTFQSEGDIETFAAASSGAAGWKKNYSPEHPDSGFVYLWSGHNDEAYFGEDYQNDYLSLVSHAKEKYIYYDPEYFSHYTYNFGAVMKDRLTALGYKVVTAADLKDFMTTRGADTALLMLQSVMPETVYDPFSAYSIGQRNIPREYLERGGTIVWTHELPFYYVARADKQVSTVGEAGLRRMLGVIPTARENFELRREDHSQGFDQDAAGYRLIGTGVQLEPGQLRLQADPAAAVPVRARIEAENPDVMLEDKALLSNLMRSTTVRVEANSVLDLGYDLVTTSGSPSQVAVRFDRDGRVLAYAGSGSWFWTGATYQPGVDTIVEFFEKGDFTELYVYPAPGPRPVKFVVQIQHPRSSNGRFYAEAVSGTSRVLELAGYAVVRDDAHSKTATPVVSTVPSDQPVLDKTILNYDTNVNFRQVSWSAVKSQLGGALKENTPVVSTYGADERLVSVARADRTVLTYLDDSDRLDAVYDLAGYLLTDYVYDASGELVEVRNEGQRRALDEALFDAKRQVSLRKTEALEDQAVESGLITQSFLDQVNVQRAQLEAQRSSVQNSLNDLEGQKMKGSDAKKAKSQALDQLRDALRQIDQARNAFEEDVARQLALLSGALNEKKLSIERDFSAAFTRIEAEFTKSLDAVALEERKAVVIDVYRTVLGRDPSAAETTSGAGQPVAALRSALLTSPDRAARAARRDAILSGLGSKLDEFLSASDSSARAAYLNALGLTAEEAVDLSEKEVTALKGFLASQSMHFAESAIDPLIELLEGEGVTITESDRTQLAVRLILIDILTGQLHPFLKEGEEMLISLYALEKTSRLYAKHSSSFKLSYEDLLDFSLKNPSSRPLVHVEGKHYVNVVSVTSTEVTISDGGEVKKLKKEDFQKVWEGTTLLPDAHAPPALGSKKITQDEARSIKGAFFFLIPAILGAIGSIVGAVGGIIASIGSILAGIGTLIGNIVVGLGNVLGGILHGIGTLTQTLFTGLKFAGTHLFGGGLTSLFAPAAQGGFFGASLNTLTAGSLFKSAVSIGLNYGLQRGLDALGVPVGISSVLTGFVTGGFLGSVTPSGFNSAVFLQEGLKGAVQAGSKSLLAASGMNSTVTDVLNILTTAPTQGGSWQGTIGEQLITINSSLAISLASYGIQKLGQTVGLDPRLVGAFALPIIGSIGRSFDAGQILGKDIIQSVFDGLTGGILQAGLGFTIEQMGIDNPLLKSLASAALTQTIASVLDPNGRIIEDLISKAGVYAQKFAGDLSSTGFMQYAQTHGISKALEDHATSMFTRGAIEEIHKAGGIAQIISGRAQLVDYNGVTLTKVSVTDKEGLVLDRNGNFVGTFRENNGVKEEVFGQFDTSSGQMRLIEGAIRQTHSNGAVSYIEVRGGKTYRLVLKQRPVSSSATVKEVPCSDTGSTCVRFDLSEGGFEPVWDWEVVENYNGELNINGFNIKDGLHFIEGAAEINVTNGFAESLNQNFEEDDDLDEFVYRQDIDYLLLNGVSSDEVAEGTPPSYFNPAISNSFIGSLAEEGVSKSKVDYVALYEDKHIFSNTITAMLLGLDPRELPESIIDIVADVLTVRLSNGFETKEVMKVRNAFDKMQLAGEDGFIPLGYSGGGAPLVNALNTTVNGAAKYSFVETAIFVGSPIFSPITNPHVKTVINLYGDQDELEVGILNGWLEPGMLSDNDFGKGRTDMKQYNIVLEGITHTEYFFNPNEHPKKIQELNYLQSQLNAVKLEPGGGNPNIINYLQEKIDVIEKVFYADAFVARLTAAAQNEVRFQAFIAGLPAPINGVYKFNPKDVVNESIDDLLQRKEQ